MLLYSSFTFSIMLGVFFQQKVLGYPVLKVGEEQGYC